VLYDLWDKVIAEDFLGQFDSRNPLSGDTSMRYRRLDRISALAEPGNRFCAIRRAGRSI
jgi:hypothetical protein